MMGKGRVMVLAAAAAIFGVVVAAAADQERRGGDVEDGAVMVRPADLEWHPAPAGLPSGARVAVLHGDPAEPGMFTVLLRMPADYEIPPHTHPAAERLTVLSGALGIGHGPRFTPQAGAMLPAGSYAYLPADDPHFVWTTEETIVQITTEGPFEIRYVDPSDDPRGAPRPGRPRR
jgi:quercetin dioxygenase-like cupin family protein